jgi:methylase of polypeptide subunit release factors
MSGGPAAAYAIGAAYEATLDQAARRQGAHYTPPAVAEFLVANCFELAPARPVLRCCDPACGGGVFLVACAQALVQRGTEPRIALDAVVGIDIDPGAAAASRAALIAWARDHGIADPVPRVEVGDGLMWNVPDVEAGFDVVVGNPPFQSQLSSATARTSDRRAEVRSHLGPAAGGYVDTAVLFLLAGRTLLAPGGVLCLIQPRSSLAARDAAAARVELAATSVLRRLWRPTRRQFAAEVEVFAPVLTADRPTNDGTTTVLEIQMGSDPSTQVSSFVTSGSEWSGLVASSEGAPDLDGWRTEGTVADLATVTAGFRDEYYALLAATAEATDVGERSLRAVTSGLIDPGICRWGQVPVRFGKRTWIAPRVDLDRLAAGAPRVARWTETLARPKVLVATQTKVIEAALDPAGDTVPVTPVIAVMPHRAEDLYLLVAALSAPPASAWMHRRRAGSGMSKDALRIAASDIAALPLPADRRVWGDVAQAWAAGAGPDTVAAPATEAYGLDADDFESWWLGRWPKRMGQPPRQSD